MEKDKVTKCKNSVLNSDEKISFHICFNYYGLLFKR